ncbi:MAG: WYL domain-containing protein [Propionibacteriaceae bacterium]|jgi:proteasome accessory factor C|nr:WYL domain-containing protein [Propionibacteriaceae bacterium]
MTSNAQVARLLALVPYLQQAGAVDLAKTAEQFSVTPGQLVKDLNVLWFCGLPQGLPDDLIEVDQDALAQGEIRLSNADFLSRPMRFTPDEAMSLVVALEAVAELADPSSAAAVASALDKLTKAQGQSVQVIVSAAAGDADIRESLLAAIAQQTVVRLTYDRQLGSATSYPEVEPVRLITRDGFAYLQAWSLERAAWRTYRLDRIAAVEATGQPAQERGVPERFDSGWLESRPDAAEVELEVSPEAGWVAEYYPVRSAVRTEHGWVLRLLVADPRWLNGLLLRLGDQVLRVSPEAALDAARHIAHETLAAYEGKRSHR